MGSATNTPANDLVPHGGLCYWPTANLAQDGLGERSLSQARETTHGKDASTDARPDVHVPEQLPYVTVWCDAESPS